MNKPKAIIVGARIAGIASSIRFALKGYDATDFEANDKARGKSCKLTVLTIKKQEQSFKI